MNSQTKAIYDRAWASFCSSKYEDALAVIQSSSPEVQASGAILIVAADSLYELGKDLEALQAYILYLEKHPTGRASSFALFNSAICLKNIGAEDEAIEVLKLVPDGHEGLQKEVADSLNRVNRLEQARKLFKKLQVYMEQR